MIKQRDDHLQLRRWMLWAAAAPLFAVVALDHLIQYRLLVVILMVVVRSYFFSEQVQPRFNEMNENSIA